MNIAKQHLINRTSRINDNATVNKSMFNALNEPDLYRFFCLSLYRNIYYNVRLRIKDIAKITGEKENTLKNFNKSMDTVLIRKKYPSPINHPVYEFTMRSLYKIPAIDNKGFITLSHKLTQVKLSVKVKGYYIKLLLIAENNTIPLTNIGIANKLGISKNTVSQYNIELFQSGLLKLFPDRLELTPNELLISNDKAKQRREWYPITADLLPNIILSFNK
ncbi:MAG: hypothetical protein ACLT3K_10770 [Bacteroides ovatus]